MPLVTVEKIGESDSVPLKPSGQADLVENLRFLKKVTMFGSGPINGLA
jgi:hypothetical protein